MLSQPKLVIDVIRNRRKRRKRRRCSVSAMDTKGLATFNRFEDLERLRGRVPSPWVRSCSHSLELRCRRVEGSV